MNRALSRLILRRYLKLIVISLFLITTVMYSWFLDELRYPVFGGGIPLSISALFIVFNSGWILSTALPLATGFATIIVYSRLPYARIMLSRTAPIFPFWKFAKPSIIPAIILSIAFFLHNAFLLPEMSHQSNIRNLGFARYHAYPDSLKSVNLLDQDIEMPRGSREQSLTNLLEHLCKSRNNWAPATSQSVSAEVEARDRDDTLGEIQKRTALSVAPILSFIALAPIGFLVRKWKRYTIVGVAITICALYWFTFNSTGSYSVITNLSPYAVWSADALLTVVAVIVVPIMICRYRALQRSVDERIRV